MKAFSFNRFLNVARWDLTFNSKFYTRSSLLMAAIICMPVVLYYLYSMLNHSFFVAGIDNVSGFKAVILIICLIYGILSSGYMFHNLLTKQGRINELTLPATNLERFLWHFVVIVIGVQVVLFLGIVFADLLNALFRLMIPGAEISSLTAAIYNWDNWRDTTTAFGTHIFGVNMFVALVMACYFRSFCLVNAWKYRYNIPLTFLIYFVLQTVLPLLLLFIGKLLLTRESAESFMEWFTKIDPSNVFVCLNIFGVLTYIGIWLLTYRLYTRAQLTTKRNP